MNGIDSPTANCLNTRQPRQTDTLQYLTDPQTTPSSPGRHSSPRPWPQCAGASHSAHWPAGTGIPGRCRALGVPDPKTAVLPARSKIPGFLVFSGGSLQGKVTFSLPGAGSATFRHRLPRMRTATLRQALKRKQLERNGGTLNRCLAGHKVNGTNRGGRCRQGPPKQEL